MQPADRQQFATAMYTAGEVFNEPVSEIRIEAYWHALVDLEIEGVLSAITYGIKSERFFPRPADIRNAIMGTAEERAEKAWSQIARAMRSNGRLQRPRELPSAIQSVIDSFGGWALLCELNTDRAAGMFRRRYVALDRTIQIERLIGGRDERRQIPRVQNESE